MALLDRIIERLSPRLALEREYSRTLLDLARKYDAAASGRRTSGWRATGTSANVEIGTAAATLRNRARDLARNSAFGASALQKLPAKVYGAGITPRLIVGEGPGEQQRKRDAASDWRAFCDNCDPEGQTDLYGLGYLAVRAFFGDGESLVRFLPQPSASGLRVPLQLQVLEADWIDSGRSEHLPDGGAIVQGVEYGPTGRRRGYWLYEQHPGDLLPILGRGAFQSRFVPARDVIHMMEPLRPGQARGVSIFAPAALKLRDLDDADDAELMRRKIAACFAAFVKRDAGNATSPLSNASRVDTDSAGRRSETLAPGLLQYLEPGESVEFGTPPNADGFIEYHKAQLRTVAAALGLPFHSLTGDFSEFNYSSYRGAVVDFMDLREHWLWHVIIPQFCERIWRRFAELQLVLGRRDPGQPYEAEWSPTPLRMLDPSKEIPPRLAAIRGGLKPLSQDLAEQGEDLEAILDAYARDNAAIDARGLVLDSDPRRVTNSGQFQVKPEPAGASEEGE